ncbi:MAG: SDR family NAD(P)-dependent oxidoreductase [Bacteroidetes bacterium]|nr:SDR family NAD(P)-dependent oxidoreductase [Bacteroidota bacterium]
MNKLSTPQKKDLLKSFGPAAFVSGASSGIGKELAYHLADAGFQLLLQGRNKNELLKQKDELRFVHGCEVELFIGDLSDPNTIQELCSALDDYPIGLAVLAAGFGTSGPFLQNSINAEMNLLRVNIEAVAQLSHYFGRRFVEDGRGGILLFSSLLAFQGTPYAANYAASKAYIQSFGEALYRELKPFGVRVHTTAPGPVQSGFEERANMKMSLSATPNQVAVSMLRKLNQGPVSTPGFLSRFLTYSLRTLPRRFKVLAIEQIMKKMTAHQNFQT